MKDKILTLINLAIIASKFIFDYHIGIMIFAIVFVDFLFDFISKHRFSNRIEKSILKKLKQHPLFLNDNLSFELKGTQVENIIVSYRGEKIGSMIEFEKYYPQSYKKFIQCIDQQALPFIEQEEKITPHFQNFIDQIDSYNIEITNEEISLGLYHTRNQLSYLQHLLNEHPKNNNKIHKLENYYLPILIDILDNYTKVAKTDQESGKDLQVKCHKTIVLINEAIKNMMYSLFEEEKMNLNADMSVLENLLKKDGLIQKNEFNSLVEEQS